MSKINTYDCDGVIAISPELGGIYPGPADHIITGRSFEEELETRAMLHRRGIFNTVHYNPLKFDDKTRYTSGLHKAKTISKLKEAGYIIGFHIEDDEIQAQVIREAHPDVHVIMIVHNLTDKENVRRLE